MRIGEYIIHTSLCGSHNKHSVKSCSFTAGPNQVIPSDTYVSWTPGEYVKLRITPRGASSEPPVSVPGLLNRTVARYPDAVALVSKRDGRWHRITYK